MQGQPSSPVEIPSLCTTAHQGEKQQPPVSLPSEHLPALGEMYSQGHCQCPNRQWLPLIMPQISTPAWNHSVSPGSWRRKDLSQHSVPVHLPTNALPVMARPVGQPELSLVRASRAGAQQQPGGLSFGYRKRREGEPRVQKTWLGWRSRTSPLPLVSL